MRVKDLAKKTGVTADTVRYYTRIGLLKPQKNATNGYKMYRSEDEQRLNFAIKARHLGFTVAEIKEIIKLSSTGLSPCCQVRKIVKTRLKEAAVKIDEMNALYARMKQAADTWEHMPDGMPTGDSLCVLIEMWEDFKLSDTSEAFQADSDNSAGIRN
jgi:MerR family Zn(II)-responsive transcriptional regulator of zntA